MRICVVFFKNEKIWTCYLKICPILFSWTLVHVRFLRVEWRDFWNVKGQLVGKFWVLERKLYFLDWVGTGILVSLEKKYVGNVFGFEVTGFGGKLFWFWVICVFGHFDFWVICVFGHFDFWVICVFSHFDVWVICVFFRHTYTSLEITQRTWWPPVSCPMQNRTEAKRAPEIIDRVGQNSDKNSDRCNCTIVNFGRIHSVPTDIRYLYSRSPVCRSNGRKSSPFPIRRLVSDRQTVNTGQNVEKKLPLYSSFKNSTFCTEPLHLQLRT